MRADQGVNVQGDTRERVADSYINNARVLMTRDLFLLPPPLEEFC